MFLAKQLVKGDDRLLATKFAQDEHRRVFFDVCTARICILFQPLDRTVQTFVNVLGFD